MTDSQNPLSGDVWKQGAKLGLRWSLVFFASALILYVVLGLVGWSGAARALCAMAAGPIFASAVIVFWWLGRRPHITPPETAPLDPTPTLVSRRTGPLTERKHHDDRRD